MFTARVKNLALALVVGIALPVAAIAPAAC